MNNQIPTSISNKTPAKSGARIKKLAISGMLVALTVALSGFSIPVGASKCFPIQHLINVLAAVFLGPVYGVSMAFLPLSSEILWEQEACWLFREAWQERF